MSSNKLLIIDAFSGGRFFPEIAKRDFGCECIHLLSGEGLPEYYKRAFKAEHFIESYTWSEANHLELLAQLRKSNLTAVVAGAETGVELADRIAFELGLLGNGVKHSRARRSKSLMHEVVGTKNLRVPLQKRVYRLEDGIKFIQDHLAYPIVVKPDNSAGTDGFSLVYSDEEFEAAFHSLLNQTNQLGLINEGVLVQEYIIGEEFAVNTVSAFGKHHVTHIWHYHKKVINSDKIYDWEEYVQPGSELGRKICQYVFSTLNALEISFGAGHTEVMLDKNGLVLIESASRVDGMCNPSVDDANLGLNQVHLALVSLLSPNRLESVFHEKRREDAVLANVSLVSGDSSGRVISKINLEKLRGLASFQDIRLAVQVGEVLKPTKDIFSSPGFVYLAGQSLDLVKADYQKIRDLESHNQLFICEELAK